MGACTQAGSDTSSGNAAHASAASLHFAGVDTAYAGTQARRARMQATRAPVTVPEWVPLELRSTRHVPGGRGPRFHGKDGEGRVSRATHHSPSGTTGCSKCAQWRAQLCRGSGLSVVRRPRILAFRASERIGGSHEDLLTPTITSGAQTFRLPRRRIYRTVTLHLVWVVPTRWE